MQPSELTPEDAGTEVVVVAATENFAGVIVATVPAILRGYAYAVTVKRVSGELVCLTADDTIVKVQDVHA